MTDKKPRHLLQVVDRPHHPAGEKTVDDRFFNRLPDKMQAGILTGMRRTKNTVSDEAVDWRSMPAKNLRQRVARRLAACGTRAATVEGELGFGEDVVRNVLRGKTKSLASHRLHELAIRLKTSAEYLLSGTQPEEVEPQSKSFDNPRLSTYTPSTKNAMPLLDVSIGAGGVGMSEDKVRGEIILPDVILSGLKFAKNGGGVHWIEVEGDSMFPTLWPGDVVAVNTGRISIAEGGVFAVQERATSEILVKRVDYAEGAPNLIQLISDNLKYAIRRESPETVRIIGRVVAKIGRVV